MSFLAENLFENKKSIKSLYIDGRYTAKGNYWKLHTKSIHPKLAICNWLVNKSRKEQNFSNCLKSEIIEEIVVCRKKAKNRWGARRIIDHLQLNCSASTVHKKLCDAGLVKKKKRKYQQRKDLSEMRARAKPFEKIQVDIKYLTDMPELFEGIKYKNYPRYQITASDYFKKGEHTVKAVFSDKEASDKFTVNYDTKYYKVVVKKFGKKDPTNGEIYFSSKSNLCNVDTAYYLWTIYNTSDEEIKYTYHTSLTGSTESDEKTLAAGDTASYIGSFTKAGGGIFDYGTGSVRIYPTITSENKNRFAASDGVYSKKYTSYNLDINQLKTTSNDYNTTKNSFSSTISDSIFYTFYIDNSKPLFEGFVASKMSYMIVINNSVANKLTSLGNAPSASKKYTNYITNAPAGTYHLAILIYFDDLDMFDYVTPASSTISPNYPVSHQFTVE